MTFGDPVWHLNILPIPRVHLSFKQPPPLSPNHLQSRPFIIPGVWRVPQDFPARLILYLGRRQKWKGTTLRVANCEFLLRTYRLPGGWFGKGRNKEVRNLTFRGRTAVGRQLTSSPMFVDLRERYTRRCALMLT